MSIYGDRYSYDGRPMIQNSDGSWPSPGNKYENKDNSCHCYGYSIASWMTVCKCCYAKGER
jgi:hypothetical protein